MTATPSAMLAAGRSGIYMAPETTTQLQCTARQGGLVWFDLDLGPVEDKADLLAVCRKGFGFPEQFGANWDALADCLQDFSWWRAPGYVIHLIHTASFAQTAPQDFSLLLEILDDAAKYWKKQGRTFVVLVDDSPGRLPLF
jgi:RNAse (barnase) inhibitor barstar